MEELQDDIPVPLAICRKPTMDQMEDNKQLRTSVAKTKENTVT